MRRFLLLPALGLVLLVFPLNAATPAPSRCAGEPSALPEELQNRADLLFFSGFETEPWTKAWAMAWGPSPSNNSSLVEWKKAWRGRSLRVKYPAGLIGGDSACQWLTPFRNLGLEAREECYARYYLRFDPGFDFVKGGKLPGLVGGGANTGGRIPNGRDGWSARLMWRTGGHVVQYVYHPDQPGKWGEDFLWKVKDLPCVFKPGVWHCVETYVRMNTPGRHDGVIRSWFDGEQALEVATLRFRDTADLKIDGFYFSTFFGGGDPSWAPLKDQYIQFDDFVLASGPIGSLEK
jgi:hypothetical protein